MGAHCLFGSRLSLRFGPLRVTMEVAASAERKLHPPPPCAIATVQQVAADLDGCQYLEKGP
uniref:Uncharacterized protein n=1 Tax=Peronospora matthiolae TaxID=2874970 RepID=A0AAV1UEY5_9STRA